MFHGLKINHHPGVVEERWRLLPLAQTAKKGELWLNIE